MMTRSGVTAVTDAMGTPADLRAYQDAREAGQLKMRVYCHIYQAFMDQMLAAGIRTGLGDEWGKVGAQKMICDGSISKRTARLSALHRAAGRFRNPGDAGRGTLPASAQGARRRMAARNPRQR